MPHNWVGCQIQSLCENIKSIDQDLHASQGTFSSDDIKSYLQQEEHYLYQTSKCREFMSPAT